MERHLCRVVDSTARHDDDDDDDDDMQNRYPSLYIYVALPTLMVKVWGGGFLPSKAVGKSYAIAQNASTRRIQPPRHLSLHSIKLPASTDIFCSVQSALTAEPFFLKQPTSSTSYGPPPCSETAPRVPTA